MSVTCVISVITVLIVCSIFRVKSPTCVMSVASVMSLVSLRKVILVVIKN